MTIQQTKMPKLHSLEFYDAHNFSRRIEFSEKHDLRNHDTTIITGVNGSNKSTILKEIVQQSLSINQQMEIGKSLMLENNQEILTSIQYNLNNQIHLIAVSGAMSDKYPIKKSGGRSTPFDVPNYLYLGQRVGANLLSKRHSLEFLAFHLLNITNKEKYKWSFYNKVYEIIGLLPELELNFLKSRYFLSSKGSKKSNDSLFNYLGRGQDDEPYQDRLRYSKADAEYMLQNFDHETFGELHEFLQDSKRRVMANISKSVECKEISQEALRLGLYAQLITLVDAKVSSKYSKDKFSIFDLSSGEYHFLSNILGIGFASQPDSIILIDEPENSLHPQWQMEFMALLGETCAHISSGHVVITTHSPLIVSAANENSTIIDLSKNPQILAKSTNLYGESADNILMDHFGLISSRNIIFIEKLQRAVNLFSLDQQLNPEYIQLLDEINKIRLNLKKDDPLIELIDVLNNGVD